jgi:ankyrin repeat protein
MFEGNSKEQKIFLISCTSENPTNISQEISQHVLFRYLLGEDSDSFIKEMFQEKLVSILREIDLESKIVQVETHRQRGKPNTNNSTVDIYVVFKIVSEKDGDWWWSFEKSLNDLIIQRSRDKDSVKNKFKGETREGTSTIAEDLEGKGCMRVLLTLFWIHMVVDAKYQRHLSRCESILPLVVKKITKIRYEYENDFTYSALSAEERNPDLSEIINFLLNVSNWHPLVVATYLGDAESFDRLKKHKKYNINGIYNNVTLLNLAILFSKTEMVQHLLGQMRADPTRCDEKGRNALHMAAKFNSKMEIVNSLISKVPIDQCDATGTTALHHAIMASNTDIVKFLLDKKADTRKKDRTGRLPLHVAAFYATEPNIIELLLNKKETVDVNDCDKFDVTALHHAAMASNVITARHLLTRGANIYRHDKRGLTPLHVAAFFAKDMELIDLFLGNKKIDLRDCNKLGQNVIAYAQKNTYGLGHEIIDRVNKIDDRVIKEYNVLKLATSEIHIPIWKSLIWDLQCYLGNAGTWLQRLSALFTSVLKVSELKLFFVPFAELRPRKGIEISESVLIRYIANKSEISNPTKLDTCDNILSDLDHCSQILQVQIYEGSKNSVKYLTRDFSFVFKTTSEKDGEHWWFLNKNVDYIVLQRSRDKDAVTNKIGGKEREDLKINIENLVEKCSIKNLLTILWIYQVMEEINQKKDAMRQSLVTVVSKPINKMKYEENLADQSDGNPVTSDLISPLSSGVCKWHPLFLPIYLGNTNLFDRISEVTKCNHFDDEISPLNLAIAFTKETKMVRHILEKHRADPTFRDVSGRNSLEMAAMHSDDTDVLDLLLRHENVKINDCDESGRTALHFAAASSNAIAAGHLIKMEADPNLLDSHGRSPIQVAAFFAKDIDIVEVFLNDKRVQINSLDNDGRNALCYAERNRHGLTKEIESCLVESGLTKRTSSSNTSVVDLVIQQYSDKELGLSLLPVRREGDGAERKQQQNDPHCTTLIPTGSRYKFYSKRASFEDLVFHFLNSSSVSKLPPFKHILLMLLLILLLTVFLKLYLFVLDHNIRNPYYLC